MRTKVDSKYIIRSELMRKLEDHLYGTSTNRHFKLLSDIITQNSALNSNTQKCVSFRGEFYVIGDQAPKQRLLPNILHSTLREQMRGYLAEVEATTGIPKKNSETPENYTKRAFKESQIQPTAEDISAARQSTAKLAAAGTVGAGAGVGTGMMMSNSEE